MSAGDEIFTDGSVLQAGELVPLALDWLPAGGELVSPPLWSLTP